MSRNIRSDSSFSAIQCRKPRWCSASSPSRGRLSGGRGESLLDLCSLGIVFGDFAEEGGLGGELGAVADDDDLRVGRIEVAARGGEDVVRGERVDAGAIGFEIIFRQAIEIDAGDLAEHAILSGHAKRKDST